MYCGHFPLQERNFLVLNSTSSLLRTWNLLRGSDEVAMEGEGDMGGGEGVEEEEGEEEEV